MNIIRKLKFNNIHPVEFTEDESKVIEIAEKTILSLFGGVVPDYYDNKYQKYIYYCNSEYGVIIYKDKKMNSIHISKPFLYKLFDNDDKELSKRSKITIEDMSEIITYYFKKHLLKKNNTCYTFASNLLDDIMKNGWYITVTL